MPRTQRDLEASMRSLMPTVRGDRARAIRFLLVNGGEVAVRSMRELAKRADVAPVSLVRLAQNLGFKGFDDFKEVYVQALIKGRGSNLDHAVQLVSLGRSAGALGFAMQFAEGEFEVQRQTLANLKEAELTAAVADLVAADRIFVVGRRPFFAPAYAFAYALRKAKPGTHLLDSGGGFGLELDGLGHRDVLVGFSAHPYSRVTLQLAQAARAQGAKVITITDSLNAPIARLANHTFLTLVRSYAFPDSTSGAQLLANILVALTVASLGTKALRRIEENEREIHASGEYVAPVPSRNPRRSAKERGKPTEA